MKNIALLLSYDGTAYHGWQIQKNAVSVCGTLKTAIEKTVGHSITLYGCGRTDSGVHAMSYVANFRSSTNIPLSNLPRAITSRLPDDIAVRAAAEVSEEFDAIGSCERKTYSYYILSARDRDPFWHGRAYHYPYPISLEQISKAARELEGTHDFAALRSVGTPVKTTVRTLYEFSVESMRDGVTGGELIMLRMTANGFLYNMARALAGTVLYVNEGKINDIPALFASRDRSMAGPVLPAHGLYMSGISYREEINWHGKA